MLTIRLSRFGATKRPTYRLIVSEKARDPWGKYLEELGFYNPKVKPPVIQLKVDRIKYWISKGAQTSSTINNLLINQKIIEGKKRRQANISKRRATKLADKKKGAEIKAAVAAKVEVKVETPAPVVA
ncbi:MAG TPA: 30S ribosomal protein S16 [Candidatus Magasanikbacteria bacterium]|uniref:Small ribosomal subunit protein bS16 n=2 Tax=Candidatus Magasanikiibacteriota TaxID=1752731 RepID=A0A0G0ZK95_9BACT|nr:MAG: 30S ribosomal protein S16 [Candidatus Magasanikbacteria bacterium GW2011_GWC2_41_17]KKS13403.1 MAG: 30S ribosomal protein S16 [Candidatus Magasanikbacteria bacterium GW2011_GWA2_41_55]HBV58035.1 30S ribosomal protein S16 [Candidatus Magasanikbacteria bacterium]HBX15691.1 30S ribosomal protein S16 [Candidatus Magasanikbacteria bacterium]